MGYHFDTESFLLAAHDMDGFKLAALDTLQHGLAGDPQRALRLTHWQEILTGISVEAGLDVIGQANAPGRSRRHLLARRWRVDGATPSAAAACLMFNSSPSAASAFGSKLGIFQCCRRLLTRLASKRWPCAVVRPCRLRIPAITASG